MKTRFLFPFLATFAIQTAQAAELAVIDIRRNIPMAENEPVYRDFYINAGEGSGLKKNLVVTAMRKVSIRDASGSQAFGEILIPVGKLKIIAIYNKVAVAREWESISRDEAPMLEQTGIMTGDRIDMAGSYIEKRRRPQTAEAEVAPATTPATTEQASTTPTDATAIPSAVTASPTTQPVKPAEKAEVPTEMLEKTADSGNTRTL